MTLEITVCVLVGAGIGFLLAFKRYVNRMNTEVADVI